MMAVGGSQWNQPLDLFTPSHLRCHTRALGVPVRISVHRQPPPMADSYDRRARHESPVNNSDFIELDFGMRQDLHRRRMSLPSHGVGGRLSQVSRKLSGWRGDSGDVVEIGRQLCLMYIRNRFKRSNLATRDLNFLRDRVPGSHTLLEIGPELERMHPKTYTGILRQSGFGEPTSVFAQICRIVSKPPMTWAKVVSIYGVAGGIAVDCLRNGNTKAAEELPDAMAEFLEEDLGQWILQNGGWDGLTNHYQKKDRNQRHFSVWTLAAIIVVATAIFLGILFKVTAV